MSNGEMDRDAWGPRAAVAVVVAALVTNLVAAVGAEPVPSGPKVVAVWLVVYLLAPVLAGLGIGIGTLDSPLCLRRLVAVAVACVAIPVVVSALAASPAGVASSALGAGIVATAGYLVPTLHARLVDRGGLADVRLGRVVVPAIAAVVAVAAVASGGFLTVGTILDDGSCGPRGNPVSPTAVQLIGHAYRSTVPNAAFAYERTNGSVTVVHDGGDTIDASQLFLTVDQTSIAWRRVQQRPTDGAVVAGERVTVPGVHDGETVEVVYVWKEDTECTRVIDSHTVGHQNIPR